jgi:hypothetical protein
MTSTYAAKTVVSVDRSQAEIRDILRRYGAEGFMFGETHEQAQLAFQMKDRRIVFRLPLPAREAYKTLPAWGQAMRTKWRSLLLCIKAKLETVATGIETFDDAFMAHIMLPSGETMSEWAAREENQRALMSGGRVPLLPAPKS